MRKAWIVTALVAACLLQPLSAAALAMASSSISFNNLSITPASGSLTMLDPWTLTAFAEANNSLGQHASQFAFDLSPGRVRADAHVLWADAVGAVPPDKPKDFVVAGGAASKVDIPGCGPAAAFSTGRGTLKTMFKLTGGTGKVDVDFGIDIAGMLNVMTDHCGLLAATETIFTLEVDGKSVLKDRHELKVGRNGSLTPPPFSLHLEDIVSLKFGVPHFLLLEADSESKGLVAEPPMMAMLLIGVVALVVARRKRRTVL